MLRQSQLCYHTVILIVYKQSIVLRFFPRDFFNLHDVVVTVRVIAYVVIFIVAIMYINNSWHFNCCHRHVITMVIFLRVSQRLPIMMIAYM